MCNFLRIRVCKLLELRAQRKQRGFIGFTLKLLTGGEIGALGLQIGAVDWCRFEGLFILFGNIVL